MHEVLVENRARRDLRRLSGEVFERVVRAMRALAKNLRPKGCRKIVGSQTDWRTRSVNIELFMKSTMGPVSSE